jgi:hypothetical protein
MISWHKHECSIIRTIVLQKGDGGDAESASFHRPLRL